jgi:hypothetical protein
LIILSLLSALILKFEKCALKHSLSSNVIPRKTGSELYGISSPINLRLRLISPRPPPENIVYMHFEAFIFNLHLDSQLMSLSKYLFIIRDTPEGFLKENSAPRSSAKSAE